MGPIVNAGDYVSGSIAESLGVRQRCPVWSFERLCDVVLRSPYWRALRLAVFGKRNPVWSVPYLGLSCRRH